MFNLVIMNTPNKNDNTAVLIFVALCCVCCCCCCSSSIISSGGLFLTSNKKGDPAASPTGASKQYTLRSANTSSNENGEGKVYYLDRHNVSCNIDSLGGINGFQLKSINDNGTIQYEYKCLNGIDTSDGSDHNTTPDVDGDPPHTVYLDRHTVDCATKPITQFRLHRNSEGDKIFYKYHCAKGPASSTCRDVTTEYNDQGAGNVRYLDRHAVKCNEGEYLSKFRLDADDNDTTGRYRYEYKCCKP